MNEVVNIVADYWLYWCVPLVFLVIVAWIYRPGAKRRYKDDGNIPFETDRYEAKARQRSH
jgi:cbb3-type cytochrome oxidase subunit 3